MFSMITDSPSDMTSDSEFAFSISDNEDSIGVNFVPRIVMKSILFLKT